MGGGQDGVSLGHRLVLGWWWDHHGLGGKDVPSSPLRGALGGPEGQGPRSMQEKPGRKQAGRAQKLLKISRFRFQSICGARLLTLVALTFSLASAAVGLRWRPLS